MSKLSDAIRRSQRIEAAPMGFGAQRPSPKATMLVAVLASAAGVERAKGADVVIIDGRRAGGKDVADAAAGLSDQASVGAWLREIDSDAPARLEEAKVDFLVFEPESTPASVLLNDKLGYVMVLPENADDSLLRSIEPLALDALYLANVPSPLTVSGQISLARVALFARKPLIARVEAAASESDLESLRSAGVAVLVVEGGEAEIARLKETVMQLPPRRARREERPAVTLPRVMPQPEEEEEEEEE